MTVTGVRAELRHHHEVAARLGRWSVSIAPVMGDRVGNVSAVVVEQNTFWTTQRPLSLWAEMGPGVWWVWSVERVVVGGDALVARVTGVPEVVRT